MEHFLNPDKLILELGLTEGMWVVDFGSGTGHMAILVAQKVGKEGKVSAVDVQTSTLEGLKEKIKSAGLENVELIHADLEVLGGTQISENVVDLVLISNVLFQSKKQAEILNEAKRILKSGGRAVIIDWKKGINGFGPPENLRLDEAEIKSTAESSGFVFERNIDAGQFHFGFIARKT